MKILVSAFACWPGVGAEPGNGWNLCAGLARRGHRVHCLTQPRAREKLRHHPLPPGLSFSFVGLPGRLEISGRSIPGGEQAGYVAWQYAAFLEARRCHRKTPFDLAHHISLGSLQMGSFLYKLPIPFIFGPAGGGQIAPRTLKSVMGRGWAREQLRTLVSNFMLRFHPGCRNLLTSARVILAANHPTLKMAGRWRHGRRGLLPMLDTALPAPIAPVDTTRKRYQGPSLRLLWVGGIVPRKGLGLCLEVMKTLSHLPDIQLTVVGDGPQAASLLKRGSRQGNVHWMGWQPHHRLREIYAGHHVFFFTSLRDSGPSQLMEAMSHGLPVVTLDLNGQADMVRPGTGFRCPPSNPALTRAQLRQAIMTLHRDRDVLQTMGVRAADWAHQHIWPRRIHQFETLYQEVLKDPLPCKHP